LDYREGDASLPLKMTGAGSSFFYLDGASSSKGEGTRLDGSKTESGSGSKGTEGGGGGGGRKKGSLAAKKRLSLSARRSQESSSSSTSSSSSAHDGADEAEGGEAEEDTVSEQQQHPPSSATTTISTTTTTTTDGTMSVFAAYIENPPLAHTLDAGKEVEGGGDLAGRTGGLVSCVRETVCRLIYVTRL
jgi:hypothetical protein